MEVDRSLLAGSTALDLNEIVLALSDSLDLVGIDDVGHGKRVAYMAVETVRRLGLPEAECERLFFAAVLHDCGISSSRTHRRLMGTLDAEGADVHCRIGHEMLLSFEPLAHFAGIVLHHHDRWRELVSGEVQAMVALLANAVHLADRADVLLKWAPRRDVLTNCSEVRTFVAASGGERFAPELVEAFLEASEAHGFWFALETRHLDRFILDESRKQHCRPMAPGDLRRLAMLFARLVDAKSPWTGRHSENVSRLALTLGRLAGLPEPECEKLELAGLLHDLGKLRVPDEILDKKERLDAEEFAVVKRHTFETWQILRRVGSFAEVAEWASLHHETPSGVGYPFRYGGARLSLPARLVSVADVFQALAQARPYRESLPPKAILGVLRRMARAGRLDSYGVELAGSNLDACWEVATATT
jgi:HD-GYP domain-containing protein (c-di-GMP phosphodiesterase class II)